MFIELQNVTKIYGKDEYATKALSQVSLQIERGEFISIMGPSGSGKSTLLNIIGCMDVPTEGVYRLEGEDVTRLNDRQLSDIRNKKVSFIFQQFALMTNFTVFENVELPLLKRNMSKKERREKVEYYLNKLGIFHLRQKNISKLSGGQKQRVAIARAMVAETNMVLADEPTGSLDRQNGEKVMELLQQMNEEGKCIIVITHDEKIASYTNRMIYLSDGCIQLDKGKG